MEITPVTVTPLDSFNSISDESGEQHMHFTPKNTKNLASSGFTDIRLVDWSLEGSVGKRGHVSISLDKPSESSQNSTFKTFS